MTVKRVRVLTRGEAKLSDLQQALDSLGVLDGDLFVIAKQDTLLDSKARARRTDPATSHEAAAKADGKLRQSQEAVLNVMRRYKGLIDEELISVYTNLRGDPMFSDLPEQAESGLRTRRRELADAGLVVDTGDRRRNAAGNNAIVWAVAPENGGDDADD